MKDPYLSVYKCIEDSEKQSLSLLSLSLSSFLSAVFETNPRISQIQSLCTNPVRFSDCELCKLHALSLICFL